MSMTADALYAECKDVVQATATAFALRFGQDVEEMKADANTAFMKGYQAIINGKNNSTDYRTEIRRWVWYELFDAYRTRTQHRRQNKCLVECNEHIHHISVHSPRNFMVDFFDGLSEDAKTTVMLVLDPPHSVADTARKKGGTDCNFRSTLRQHLRDQGWHANRIAACFAEVAEALC